MDELVDEITRRVEQRINSVSPLADASDSGGSAGCGNAVDGGCASAKGGASYPDGCDSCRGCHVNRDSVVRDLVELGLSRLSAGIGHESPPADLAPLIDHTLLKPDATREQLQKVCDEARKYGFATVCVNSCNIRFCAGQLQGSGVRPIAVVGFPLGAATTGAKAYEARAAIRHGALEIDMVINLGALKSGDFRLVLDDIAQVVAASAPKPVKVILETGMLSRDQKVIACTLAKVGGAAFVKTSTGFGAGGATAEDIALMREIVGPEMGVKASGGVRTRDDALKMIDAGATRVGASGSVAIVTPDNSQPRRRGYRSSRSNGAQGDY